MMLRRIVCGVDGSEAGFEALRQARRLLLPGGRLVAVVVAEERIAVHTGMWASEALHELRTEAEASRQAAVTLLADLADADAMVVAGRPDAALLAVATRERADLLAVGTVGKRRLPGMVLGSVATRMLGEAPCSVLVARRTASPATFPRSIVVGVDGSAESVEAVTLARALADRFESALRVLAASGGRGGADPRAVRARITDAEVDPRGALEALEAASNDADLLLVGSRGLRGVRSLGSVSERLAHRARCSVLVVRSPGYEPSAATV